MLKGSTRTKYQKHGLTGTPIFIMWKNMMNRCYLSKARSYKWYGGRGIGVCEAWHDVAKFAEDVLKLGYKQGLEIDRIDTNGHYEPNNVKFSTKIEQMNNMNKNLRIEYKGNFLTVTEWSRKLNIPISTICQRFHRGCPAEEIFEKQRVDSPQGKRFSRAMNVEIGGENKKLSDWLDIFGISYNMFRNRVYGSRWDILSAIQTPPQKRQTHAI